MTKDAIENEEECLLATSCGDYGQTNVFKLKNIQGPNHNRAFLQVIVVCDNNGGSDRVARLMGQFVLGKAIVLKKELLRVFIQSVATEFATNWTHGTRLWL